MAKIQSNKKLFIKLGDIFGISIWFVFEQLNMQTTDNKLIFCEQNNGICYEDPNMSTKASFEAQNTVKSQNINIFCN